ncbi:MAG TPA: ABC transporter ATP-binding protein [Kofleriaceae bacterium]|nr:ABC transporter ATP-binding protein [Kofleriaceae bacterium]
MSEDGLPRAEVVSERVSGERISARSLEAPARPPLIELKGVTKRYGAITALSGIDGVIDGRIIGLLGPNGAGKSTLLKSLLGLIPHEGQARVLGLSTHTQGREIRDRVGYMPEQEAFLAGMSAVELCTYAGELSGLPRTEAMQRAHAALYYAGLEEKRYQPIDGYSTGMKQRVKLAQALVHDPEILFLDEPTNGLDPRSREEMLQLITEMPERRGCTIVLSTHLLPDVERVCDRAVIMHQGRVRFVGTIDELRGARGRDTELQVEVKAEAQKLADALQEVGAGCEVKSPVLVFVNLPANATTHLVFKRAKDLGIQVRGIEVRRESVEVAFLRVIGAAPTLAPGAVVPATPPTGGTP